MAYAALTRAVRRRAPFRPNIFQENPMKADKPARGEKPLREPARRRRHRTLPGVFPTSKNPRGYVRTRLPLMMDGLVHIDTDPTWTKILPYAEVIRFWGYDRRGRLCIREHVPDLKVMAADGDTVFIDYIPYALQQEDPYFERHKAAIEESCWERHRASYAVHDELCIYREPLYSNLTVMWRHRLDGLDDEAVIAVRKAVARLGRPSTIGEITREAALPGIRMEWDGAGPSHSFDMDDVDRAFSAIMQLTLNGEVETDLSRRLSSSTEVSVPGAAR